MENQKQKQQEKSEINTAHHKEHALKPEDEEMGGLPGGNDEGAPLGSRGDNKKHPHNTQDYGSRTNKK